MDEVARRIPIRFPILSKTGEISESSSGLSDKRLFELFEFGLNPFWTGWSVLYAR